MASELLDVDPHELRFTFELKKQSSCSVQLTNKTDQYVAFKVKTTSPKRYCVRPNAGIVLPKSTLDFTVTLQAMKVAPDMQCKDKFLIQSTTVPFGVTEDELKPDLFSKESGKYIEENKLRVIFISLPHSPVIQPLNPLKEEQVSQTPALSKVPVPKDTAVLKESISPRVTVGISPKETSVTISKETHAPKVSDSYKKTSILYEPESTSEGIQAIHASHDVEGLKVSKYIEEELRSRISILESRIIEDEKKTAALKEEKSIVVKEIEKLKHEQALMKRKCIARVQKGFPFLFVCFIGMVGIVIGYKLRGS